jgi:hypothetical protein
MGTSVSETAKFSSKDIKGWLERETGSLLTPIHSKAQKLLGEMRKAVENLSEVSKMLLENSAKEIEKRNQKTYGRARALNKLARLFVDRMRQIRIPDKVTYDTFQEFVQQTQKAFLVTEVDVRNFFPHVSPFFILDRRKFQLLFDRSRGSLKELNSFLTKEYVKAKTLEEAFLLIDKLHAFEQQLANLKEQKAKTDNQKTQIEKEIAETQQKMADLRSKGSLSQLSQTDAEISALSAEVKQSLQHLQKPFIKLQSLATRGEGSGLTPEETSKLNQYVENPFEAFATEEPSHPLLRQILQKLDRAMSEDKLKLKPEKTRKAEQLVESILNQNSLVSLHQKSMNVMARRKQLSASAEVAETEKELSKLREQLDAQERRKKVVEGEQVMLERTITETVEKIRNHKNEIEKKVFESMNKKVHIE